VPQAPVLDCVDLDNGNISVNCGAVFNGQSPTGTYFIAWFPIQDDENPVLKYTVYAKQGTNTVSTTNFDQIWFVSPNQSFFITPVLPTTALSFIVTASNKCGQSQPSQVFNVPAPPQ